MKSVAFILLLTLAFASGQNESPVPSHEYRNQPAPIDQNPRFPSIPEAGSPDEIPPHQAEAENSPLISGLQDEQFLAEGGEDANNLERPKRLFWDLLGIRNNHYHYHGDGRSYNSHSHYRRYCRHYHNHCYRSPYYHCENVCDSWGYYYY